MPKRKIEKEYDYIKRKLKRLEKRLGKTSRSCRRGDSSDSSTSRSDPQVSDTNALDAWILSDEEAADEAPSGRYWDLEPNNLLSEGTPVTTAASTGVTASTCTTVPTATTAPTGASATTSAAAPTIVTPPTIMNQPTESGAALSDVAPSTDATTTGATNDVTLDADLLEILGTDPNTVKKYGKDIQKDLSARLEHYAVSGLSKELRKEYKEKYLTPDNCKLIDPPELNAELKAAVSEAITKRDKAIEGKQKQLSSAISCFSEPITLLMSNKEKNTDLIKLLIDGVRILCDCQHAETLTRRGLMLHAVKKDMKEQLQNTKIDKFLFGENLTETLRTAKAINKSGADLKVPAPKIPPKKPVPSTSNFPRNLNWKNPGPARRQQGPPRMKEPATTSTRSQPTNSYRPSQRLQPKSSHNRR